MQIALNIYLKSLGSYKLQLEKHAAVTFMTVVEASRNVTNTAALGRIIFTELKNVC